MLKSGIFSTTKLSETLILFCAQVVDAITRQLSNTIIFFKKILMLSRSYTKYALTCFLLFSARGKVAEYTIHVDIILNRILPVGPINRIAYAVFTRAY